MSVHVSGFAPELSRRGGGMMWCDKLTSVLFIDRSFDEFSHLLTAGENEANPKSIEDGKVLQSVFSHEQDHLRRQFATSAGLIQLQLASRLVALCQSMCHEAAKAALDFPFPLVSNQLARKAIQYAMTVDSPLEILQQWTKFSEPEQHAIHAISTSLLMQCLEGEQRASMPLRAQLALAEFALISLNIENGKLPYTSSAAETLDYPEATGFWEGSWPGTKHLFEQSAMAYEMSFLTLLGGSTTPWQARLELEQDYNAVLHAWFGRYPKRYHTHGERRESDLFQNYYRALPVEFYAAVDLAWSIPWSPTGLIIPSAADGQDTSFNWTDVQPGWRLFRSFCVLSDIEDKFTPITSDQRENVFAETQQMICNANNWPKPESVVRDWLSCTNSGAWRETFLGHFDEPSVNTGIAVMNSYLQKPFDVVLNNVDWGEIIKSRFQVWVTSEKDGQSMRAVAEGKGPARAMASYYLYRGSLDLLFGTSGISALRQSELQLAVKSLNSYFSKKPEWDSDYFLSEASVAFAI